MRGGASREALYTVFTDGGADPNPGTGGWGAVVVDRRDQVVEELSGSEPETTNNRMELTAAIRALEALDGPEPVRIVTDSIYLKKGITEWLPRWVAQGWKRKGGALQNEDLWRRLASLVADRPITWGWVKSHAGHRHNERADRLATAALRELRGEEAGGVADEAPALDVDVEIFLKVSGGKGWAAILYRGEDQETRTGRAPRGASSNELDILAAAELLESLPEGTRVALHTASDYLRNGATQWIGGWRRRGWTTKGGQSVKNREAWERLDAAASARQVTWPSVKGVDRPEWKPLGKLARGGKG